MLSAEQVEQDIQFFREHFKAKGPHAIKEGYNRGRTAMLAVVTATYS